MPQASSFAPIRALLVSKIAFSGSAHLNAARRLPALSESDPDAAAQQLCYLR